MKKILSAALCAASLAVGLAGTARADQVKLITLKPSTGLTETGAFSDAFASDTGFIDDYLFANQPSYSLDEYTASGTGVTFTSVALFSYPFGDDIPNLVGSLGSAAFDVMPDGVLPGELWVLQISGSAIAGGSYSGLISSTVTDAPSPVPEPAGWMLLVAGLGAVGARAKRSRRGTAAA